MENSIEEGKVVSDENANQNSSNRTKQFDDSLLQKHFANYDHTIVASKLQNICSHKVQPYSTSVV